MIRSDRGAERLTSRLGDFLCGSGTADIRGRVTGLYPNYLDHLVDAGICDGLSRRPPDGRARSSATGRCTKPVTMEGRVTSNEGAGGAGLPGIRDWSTAENRAASLARLHDDVVSKAEGSINWYKQATRPNKRYARALRGLSIVLVSAAALIPLVSQIRQDDGWTIEPAWASIVLGAAVALVALDKFFGFSSAWARFTVAQFQLESELHSFELEWQSLLNDLDTSSSPTSEEARTLIEALKRFIAGIDSIVQNETAVWVAEFSSALGAIEESTEALP